MNQGVEQSERQEDLTILVKEVVLADGTVLEADVVVAGIGAIPNSDFLTGSNVAVDSRKAVIVDKFMRTNVADVFSAGDVASFPLTIRGDQRVNIGHWQMSHAHGRVAALNMLNKPTTIESVPFFWSALAGKSIRYAGYGEGYTEIIIKGKLEERKFVALYIKDGVVVAAASMGMEPAVSRVADLLDQGRAITKTQAQMKEVTVEDQKVLLVRTKGQYSAVGGRCTHYNAPLIIVCTKGDQIVIINLPGTLVGDRVRCPIHGACFNVKTGDIEDYPGLDCLPTYKVKVQDGNVYVSVDKKSLKLTKRMKEMCTVKPDVKHIILLVGGGPASLVCAETLRQNCYQGRIIIVTKDNLPPFDKPKLSKAMNVESSSILLRQHDFYQQHGIEMWTGKEVVSVNSADKVVKMSDGTSQRYDQLLISTGCRRSVPSPVSWIRFEGGTSAAELRRRQRDSCIISWQESCCMEAASYLSDKAASVTLVGPTKYPFQKSLGPEIGKMTMEMLEEKKVKFVMNNKVTEIRGEDGKTKY
ncbi:hypothetical protein CCH79_00003784 [Gambusia affinis]|uniref:Rieske domain-containing protein n=1 Tax=Gambusia affinis TaxID=33528 RepID=A0A315VCI5_GAMAF|nr:hypothetical protein CCH79_00003784 [Gambusia affinis]